MTIGFYLRYINAVRRNATKSISTLSGVLDHSDILPIEAAAKAESWPEFEFVRHHHQSMALFGLASVRKSQNA